VLEIIGGTIEWVITRVFYNDVTIANYFRGKGAIIGKGCVFYVRNLGSEPYLINIGDHVAISQGVVFHTHNGGWISKIDNPGIVLYGRIFIEDNCLIGLRSQIFGDVRIGRNSIVGAGSVVINNVPPNSIVMGNPARVIGSSLKYKEKCVASWKEIIAAGFQNLNGHQRNKALKKFLLEYYKNKDDQRLKSDNISNQTKN
jgi:acetyltransferase-like isoleucine patch superfamily enzyme